MLNLKKGLALVLAAATAFTFAPVANLGVTAHAEQGNQSYTLENSDFALDATGEAAASESRKLVSDTAGQTINGNITVTAGALATGTTFSGQGKGVAGYDFDGLWITRNITLNSNRLYDVKTVSDGIDNNNIYFVGDHNALVQVKQLGSFYTKTSSVDKTGNEDGDVEPTTYKLIFRLKSANGGYIVFSDRNAVNNTYDQVTYTVYNNGKSGKRNTYSSAVFQWNQKSDKSGYEWQEATHENNSQANKQYSLQLNNNTDSNYAIGVTTNGTVKTWTGYTAKLDSVSATSTSGNLKWTGKKLSNGDLTTALNYTDNSVVGKIKDDQNQDVEYSIGTNGGVGADKKPNTGDNLFYVTASNSVAQSITIDYTLKDTASKATTHDSETLKYVVDRSNNAVDWIKWVGDKNYILNGSAEKDSNWSANTTHDTYTYRAQKDLDPYINTSADIVVKSESTSLRFISSDSSILSVTENYQNKYYKAHVEAKSAGTATLSIYVNGTANNKGKIYNIPVKVSANAKDKFKIDDSEKLYGSETAETIYLDAADQEAANKVISDKLTIQSLGGLKLTNVKSSDTSVATIGSDLTINVVAKKADVVTPKSTTISWESVSAGQITGNTGSLTVVVWAKPRADFSVDPVQLDLGSAATRTKTLSTNPVHTNVVWSIDSNGSGDELGEDEDAVFTLTNGNTTGNTQTTATVVARSYGSGSIKALVTETATTRPTAIKVPVTVGAENKNVLSANPTSVLLTEGDTATVNVTSSQSKAVSVKVNKTDVATAVSGAAVSGVTPITVTAVKAGTTEIVVTSDGADTLTIPVVVVSKNAIENATPEKVTGLKVSNKKGAYVSVKWTSQGKNINYRVYKKVGKGKWVGKNVAGSKTTLSVKKGAKVQVKVKSYVKDPNGKTTWGPAATKAKTFKTDKK